MKRDTQSKRAYACYLEGEKRFSTQSVSELEHSEKCFAQATRHDKRWARAFGFLAYTQAELATARWSGANVKSLLAKARKNALKAVELDTEDYANHWDLGFCELKLGDFGAAVDSFETALNLYHTATPHIDCKAGLLAEAAEAMLCAGQHMRAIELAEEAMRIPDWYRWVLAMGHYCVKDYQRTLEVIDGMHRRPGDPRYLIGVELLKAAAHVRLSEQQPSGSSEQRQHMARACTAMARFRSKSPDWTCAREKVRMKFKNRADGEHWVGALKQAGLP